MFNWFWIKKLSLGLGIGASVSLPIFLFSKPRSIVRQHKHSEFKKGLINSVSENLYSDTKFQDFFESLINTDEGSSSLRHSFVKKLSELWVTSRSNPSSLQEYLTREKAEFLKLTQAHNPQGLLSDQRVIYDSRGGSRKKMENRFVADAAYKDLKELLTKFASSNFVINPTWTKSYSHKSFFVSDNSPISTRQIDNKERWDRIGFFPVKDSKFQSTTEAQKKQIIGKFHFLNWAYKYWYANHLPFYTWMSLWKHDESAKPAQLEARYDKTKVTGGNLPDRPNYFFPLFKEETVDSKQQVTKFVNLAKQVSKLAGEESPTISKEYTDDSGTVILVEAATSHDALYPEFASGANYLFQKMVDTTSVAGGAQPPAPQSFLECLNIDGVHTHTASAASTTHINELSEGDLDKAKNPIDLFLLKTDSAASDDAYTPGSMYIGDDLIKSGTDTTGVEEKGKSKTKRTLYEARELKDKGWLYLRNIAGVHAIMIDGQKYVQNKKTSICPLKAAFQHFNFRNLQILHKDVAKIKNSIEIGGSHGINKFRDYLDNNFDKLFTNYFLNTSDSKSFLFSGLSQSNIDYLNKFKDFLNSLDLIEFYKKKFAHQQSIRSKIISTYSKRDWEYSSTDPKVIASASIGLAGSFPYKYDAAANKPLFPDQEWFLKRLRDLKEDSSVTDTTSLVTAYEGAVKKRADAAKKLSARSELIAFDISGGDAFFESDRLFMKDEIFNRTYEDSIVNKDFLNYLIKVIQLTGSQSIFNKFLYAKKIITRTSKLLDSAVGAASNSSASTTFECFIQPQNIQKSLKESYYFNFFFENPEEWFAPLAIAKYPDTPAVPGAGVTPTSCSSTVSANTNYNAEAKKIKDFLFKNAEEAFKTRLYFGRQNTQVDYLDRLLALQYYLEPSNSNHLEGLRKHYSSQLVNGDDAYFIFSKNELDIPPAQVAGGGAGAGAAATYQHLYSNPYLNNVTEATNSFVICTQEKFSKLFSYMRANELKEPVPSAGAGAGAAPAPQTCCDDKKPCPAPVTDAKGTKFPHNFQGLYVANANKSNFSTPYGEELNKTQGLYAFGSRANLIDHIKTITTGSGLEKLLSWLGGKFPSWDLSAVKASTIQITKNSSNETKTLSLVDKKNALISFVNNYKMPTISAAITNDESKRIYGWNNETRRYEDLKSSVQTTGTNHQANIADACFTKKATAPLTTNKTTTPIQINHVDLSSHENFKTWINNHLNQEMLSEILFYAVMSPSAKKEGENHYFNNLAKFQIHDKLLKDNIDKRYINYS